MALFFGFNLSAFAAPEVPPLLKASLLPPKWLPSSGPLSTPSSSKAEGPPANPSLVALKKEVKSILSQHPGFAFQPLADPKGPGRALSLEIQALAKEHYENGLESWKALHPEAAEKAFIRAEELYRSGLSELFLPGRFSELLFARALVQMDLEKSGEAQKSLTEALAIFPSFHVQQGYYTQRLEALLEHSFQALIQARHPIQALWDEATLLALSETLGKDVLFLAVAKEKQSGFLVHLQAFHAKGATWGEALTLSLKPHAPFPKSELEAFLYAHYPPPEQPLSDKASAHQDEAEAPEEAKKASKLSPWLLELGYQHHLWIQHQNTRNFLHGPGLQIGVSYLINSGIELWANTKESVTLQDRRGDLLAPFTTGHIAFGASLVHRFPSIDLFLKAGLDMAFSFAEVESTTDVNCKFFGRESPLCGTVNHSEAPGFWLGLEMAIGLRIRLWDNWNLGLSLGGSAYVMAGSVVKTLNFPVYSTLSLGIPF